MNTDAHRSDNGNGLTERIIGCAFQVSNTLGCGFLKAAGLASCLPLNVGGPKLEIRRVVRDV